MTDAQIAGNKAISNFIGGMPQYKKAEKYYRNEIKDEKSPDRTGLEYHSSYDWLMPVAKALVDGYYDTHELDDLMVAGGRFDLDEIFGEVVATIIEIEKSV